MNVLKAALLAIISGVFSLFCGCLPVFFHKFMLWAFMSSAEKMPYVITDVLWGCSIFFSVVGLAAAASFSGAVFEDWTKKPEGP